MISTKKEFNIKKTLVIFTKKYPYDSGEEFIDNEIAIDAEAFDKVLIVSTALDNKSIISRNIPKNVKVIGIKDIQNSYLRYFKYICYGCSFLLIDPSLQHRIYKAQNLREKLATLYIFGRAIRNKKKIEKINEIQESLHGTSILYSYWCTDLALTVAFFKEEYKDMGVLRAVSRAHGYDLYEDRNIAKRIPFRDYVFQRLDAIFPCSEDGTNYLREKYPEVNKKICTSYLGTKRPTIKYAKKTEKKSFRVVTCSRIVPGKRVDLVAKALKHLEEKKIWDIEWICIGDGPLLEDIKCYVGNNLKINQAVFLGQMNNEEVLKYYENNNIDLFINVSTAEGLPVSIMEAISFGIPILATDVGGVREIVRSREIGLLMNADIDAIKLGNYILAMKGRVFERNKIIEFWNDNFCADKNYNEFTKQLLTMIE